MHKPFKYPTTQHIHGSRLQQGDEGKPLVRLEQYLSHKEFTISVSEKLDGANCGILFSASENPMSLRIQSRSRFLPEGKCPPQFLPLLTWSQQHRDELCDRLQDRYLVYFESMQALHTIFYDKLTSYFYETAILNMETGDFLCVNSRRKLLVGLPIVSAPILARGQFTSVESVLNHLQQSKFRSNDAMTTLKQVCKKRGVNYEDIVQRVDKRNLAEGLYITVDANGRVIDRCKYVRRDFENKMGDSNVRFIPNQLAGVR